jgi:hypothetical protein
MPAGKKSRRARGNRGNQVAVSKFAGDAYSLGERALKGLNQIRKLINIETKYTDVLASYTPNNTISVTYFTPIAQGLDNTNRVGDSIRLQSLDFSWCCLVSTSATYGTALRVIIVRDNENQAAAPTGAQLLVDPTAPLFEASPYVYLNLRRFAILYDENILLDVAAGGSSIKKGGFSSSHNGHVKFRGTGATSASAGEGSIWMFLVSNQASLTPAFNSNFRLTYTDD